MLSPSYWTIFSWRQTSARVVGEIAGEKEKPPNNKSGLSKIRGFWGPDRGRGDLWVMSPVRLPGFPQSVLTDNAEMQKLLTSYDLEFYELVTPEKLSERGLG